MLGLVRTLKSPADLHAARMDALALVTTPLCFFLDDDDKLPADYLDVLDQCADKMRARGVPMAYTDEIQREVGKADVRRSWYEYDSARHLNSPMGLHHLVLMDTAKAQSVAATLLRGNYWTEHMLYWALGRQGAAYVPRVGYIWSRKAQGGFSRDPRTMAAMIFSQRWIAQQAGVA